MKRSEVRAVVRKAIPEADTVVVVPMDFGESTGIAVQIKRGELTHSFGATVKQGGLTVREAIARAREWADRVAAND